MYTIVWHENKEKLQELIQEHLAEGWECDGEMEFENGEYRQHMRIETTSAGEEWDNVD